ncbi:hypothetical protein GE061_009639 [Apolygus lucorum]|uniref:FLYWCH-type domain-containing protein n=1 Tax=Apolygus lucorum TaxID=248454 RepID=A0A8S9Y236_APOLU|nr:hypothetical protein GE061_009639 [Apolygus lucorum]
MNSMETRWVKGGGRKGGNVIFRSEGNSGRFFKFVYHKDLAESVLRWTCAQRTSAKCGAFLKTLGEQVIFASEVHAHEPPNDFDVVELRTSVKRKACEDISTAPRKVIRRALMENPDMSPNVRDVKNLRFRKIQALGLAACYKDDENDVGRWLHWTFGLPYCQPDEVGEAFCSWIVEKPELESEKTQTFAEYIHNTYVAENSLFPPKLWACKTEEVTRTTNACESFHSSFNKDFNSPHPNIFEFQTEVYTKLQSVHHVHVPLSQIRKQQAWIRKWIDRQERGDVELFAFIKIMSFKLRPHFPSPPATTS